MSTVTRAALLVVVLAFAGSAGGQDPTDAEIRAMLDESVDLGLRPLAQRGEKWECVPAHRFVCTREGCERDSGRVSVRLDFGANTYSRCDEKGCDTYPMLYSGSGIFTTARAHGGTFLKVLNDGSQYVEVVSLHLAIHQSFGKCTRLP
jgi:hypothetical protein